MPKFLLLIIILLLHSVLFSQNANVASASRSNTSSPVPSPTPKSIIRGKAIYEDSGKPIRRARIGLLEVPKRTAGEYGYETLVTGNEIGISAFSETDGSFVLQDVPPGEYYAIVDIPGILNPKGYRGFNPQGQPLAGAKFEDLFQRIIVNGLPEIQVNISAKRSAAITGRISFPDGEPAVGQKVEALRSGEYGFEASEYDGLSTAQTDDRGIYRFAGLPPGKYVVRVTETATHLEDAVERYGRPQSQLTTYFPDKLKVKDAEVLELDLGTEKPGIDISIGTYGFFRLSGRVIAKTTKQPIDKARLTLDPMGDRGLLSGITSRSLGTATTDAQGNWSFKNLLPGKYRLSFEIPYSYGEEARKKEARKFAQTSISVEIADCDKKDVLLEVPFESTISGTISTEGKEDLPESIYIFAYDEESENFSSFSLPGKQSGENGKQRSKNTSAFELTGLANGKYMISVASLKDFYVKSAKAGDLDLTTEKLSLKEGVDVTNFQIVLSNSVARVKGVVVDGDKQRVEFGKVQLIPAEMKNRVTGVNFRVANYNENGEFALTAAPGEYYLVAFQENIWARDETDTFETQLGKIIAGAEKVTLKAGDNSPVTVKLREK